MTIPGLQIDWNCADPVYRQIATAIRRAVVDGRLPAGHRLPATRDLARQLGVNRNTVVAAYEALSSEGWTRSHTGRGTFVVGRPEPASAPASAADSWFTAFSRTVEGAAASGLQSIYRLAISPEDAISFVGSYPTGDLLPVDSWKQALAETLEEQGSAILGYGPTAGQPALREIVSADMQRHGSTVSADEILITNGAQQALHLVLSSFVERGDDVLIEEPTYTGALSVLSSLGARAIGVPVDDQGIRPDLLALALERHKPRLLYLQPTFQNPTTCVMGEGRRREVLALARRYACLIVEDDWAGDLRFEGVGAAHAACAGRRAST